MTFSHVAVLLINYQRTDLTLTALAHVLGQYPDIRAVVVDNASATEAVTALQQGVQGYDSAYVTLVLSPINTGFSGGTNLGLSALQANPPQYVWLLNNDALPEPGALEAMLNAHPGPALVGSTILTEGKPPYRGGIIDWWHGSTQGHAEGPWDYVTAASLLIPWSVVQQLGPWDERYFLYVEDIEYGVRAARQGIPVISAAGSHIMHLKGQTTGGSANPVNQYYAARNRLLLFQTYASQWQMVVIVARYLGRLLFWFFKAQFKPHYRQKFIISWLAFKDWAKQTFGPCPHIFEPT
jgi:GT2 family glycosyltransferase